MDIIYEDDFILAAYKAPGVPVQNDLSMDKSLIAQVKEHCNQDIYLLHRIDRPVGGIVLFAKNKKTAKSLYAQFERKTVRKAYLAIVRNKPEKDNVRLEHHLVKRKRGNYSIAYATKQENSKNAILNYKFIDSIDNYHLLEIKLETGRHHQIRAQLSKIGSPIRGDVKYGYEKQNRDKSINLHAWIIDFMHPDLRKIMTLTAPLPINSIWEHFKVSSSFFLNKKDNTKKSL